MKISYVVAADVNGVIGRGNELPWHLPADLRHFKQLTMDRPIMMGRRTHESIGRPLPGRHNIVVTRQVDYRSEGCDIVHSIDEAIDVAGDVEELMVIGGSEFYEQLLARVDRIYMTEIHHAFEGDTYFPKLDITHWRESAREDFPADADNRWDYSFVIYERAVTRTR